MVLGLGVGLLCGSGSPVQAFSGGVNGYSGNPATGGIHCTLCHMGGATPIVTLAGPTVVMAGTVNTYTLTIFGGQQVAGGLDVSSDLGTLSVNPGDGGTHLVSGEITHLSPRSVGGFPPKVIWSFDWQAPATAGTATIYGAGNSVNLAQGNGGDLSATTTLQIMVAAGAGGTPGESSAPGALQPLLVTGYDNLTGEISISYESGCDTDENNVYYGPLSQVSTLNWTAEICDIGTTGTTVIQPNGPSIFFVIVGNKGGDDGSYGRSSAGLERAPILLNICGEVQDLSDACLP